MPDWNHEMRRLNGNWQKQLGIFHQNIQGAKGQKSVVTNIEILINKLVPDILIVSEADTEVVTSWKYPGYTAHKGQLLGGGDLVRVTALVRNSIKHTISYLECEVPNVVVNFKIGNSTYRVTGIYREWNYSGKKSTKPEQEARWSIFEDAWVRANRRCRNSVLLGDLNFDYAGNGSIQSQSLEPIRSSVMDNIILRGWSQLISKPTRHQGTQVPSCLDHIYYNNLQQVKYSVNKIYTPGDHNCVGLVIKTQRFIPEGEEFLARLWDKVNWKWGAYLVRYSSTFYKVFSYSDPNDILDFIEVELRTIMDTIAPEQLVRTRPGEQRWMTTHIKDCLRHRDKLKEVWIRSGLRSDERKWRDAKREVRFKVRRAKEEQVAKDLEIKCLKKRWKKIHTITGGESNSGPPTELVEGGVTYKDPLDIANIMNKGFREKVDGILARTKIDPVKALEFFEDYAKHLESKKKLRHKFQFEEVDCRDVRRACMSLHNTAALGTDGIPTIIIKQLSRELAPFLAYLINQIFRTGIFPERWRQGIIAPVHKSGSRTDKLNYRPVTITNSLSKVWERIVNNQMTEYFRVNDIIDRSQHSYRRNRGCSSYWIDLSAKICQGKDTGKKVLLQCYDLSAAFNLCNADIIGPKLARVGFMPEAINILLETMKRRQIKTKIDGVFSEVVEVSIGSAEGGIVSPNLFNFSLCDIAAVKWRIEAAAKAGIRTEQAMLAVEAGEKSLEDTAGELIQVKSPRIEGSSYADDNSFVTHTDTEEELRAIAFETDRQVLEYFETNGMAPNRKKTETLSLANRFARPVTVGGVSSQDTIKLLGVRLTKQMSFYPQAVAVCEKVSKKLPQVARLRDWASKELLIRVAKSMLISYFEFCLEIWGGENRVQALLQKAQNKILRTILGHKLSERVSVASMLNEVDWDSVPNMVRYRILFWIRKVDREACAPYMWHLITTGANSVYNTRHTRIDVDFMPRTLTTTNWFTHSSLKYYNMFNFWPDCCEFEDYKIIARQRILDKWPNGNI